MLHLGDITKISGYDVPPVDVIVGGSPCQDLSIAGKRAGLDGERSGLFMEQLRIIKEMRENDRRNGRTAHDVRPRYMVWENVPGAFSSHGGEDFRIVLEETAKVAEKDASIPMPDNGKWSTSGCVMGNGWSIAWRILDAQFWGVPQRRRRIALVADFGGQSASEILFVRKSVSGHSEQSQPQRKETPCNASRSTGADDCIGVDIYNTTLTGGKACPLTAEGYGSTGTSPKVIQAYTLKIRSGCDGGGKGALIQTDVIAIDQGGGKSQCNVQKEKSPTLTCTHGGEPAVCYSIGAYHSKAWESDNPNSGIYEADKSRTLDALNCGYTACNQGGIAVVEKDVRSVRYIVRRLTPMECERLQGYPDGWTDIGEYTDTNGKNKKSSDSARYKALGNSIAIPPWKWVMKRISACYERDATLASLFDGIGGFPYIWEQINGKGSCLWASEIEEFCIAVTKRRIG